MADTTSTGPWKARPIFISSTFKDMQAERDYLRSHVFPRLEEELRRRRHQLEPIDLRLGVETAELGTEEARELLVLKVCLSEIQRSRPFLLVLLGDRYGWVPPEERMAASTEEAGFHVDVRGKSVTALEIEFGVLKEQPEQRRRSFFYFREPLPYDAMPADIAAQYSDAHSPDPAVREGKKTLEALKTRLRHDPELAPRVCTYRTGWDNAASRVTGLEPWGDMVFEHVWRELDAETRAFAAQPPPTEEAEERAALVEFVEFRRRDFTGRANLLRQLHDIATAPALAGTPWGTCLAGAPGSGKSAIFAELWQRLADDSGVLLLANAAGGTPRGSQPDAMLRRFVQELAEFLGVADPLPEKASPDDVDAAFAALLARAAARKRVVVLLDALDQYDPTPRGQHLTWLRAKQWPLNARLIATALPSTGAKALTQLAGIEKIQVPPLAEEDVTEIAQRVWARYHRQLNPAAVRILAEKKLPDGTSAASNPLWLTLALEQLNLLDADDFARAERQFTGTPAERLRALVIDTANRMPPAVPDLYGWLLAQTEKAYGAPHARAFAALIAVSRFGWRETDLLPLVPRVARLLDPGLNVPDLDNLHLAALRRGFRAHLARRGAAGQLDFFHTQVREAVRQRALGDPQTARQIHRAIADHLETLSPDDPLRQTELMVHLIEGDDAPRAARVYADVSLPFATTSGATQALARHIALGAGRQPNPNVPWIAALLSQPGLVDSQVHDLAVRFLFYVNDAIENTADLPARQALLESARQSLARLTAADPTNSEWQRDLSASHIKVGDVLRPQGDLAGALQAYRESRAVFQRLAAADPTNAGWQRDLSVSHNRVGEVLRAQGDLAGALQAYRESLTVAERLTAADPANAGWQHDLASAHCSIGIVLQAQGQLAAALEAYRRDQEGMQRLAAADPTNVGWQRDLSVSHNKVGDVLSAQGDLAGALEAYRESLTVFQRLAAADPTNAGWQRDLSVSHNKVGDVLRAQGDSAGALEAYRESLAVFRRLATADPTNAGRQRDLASAHCYVGMVLQGQGQLSEALEAYREWLVVARLLAAADPTNAGWQRDLSVSQERIGGALLAQGDLAGALQAYQESLEIAERLAAADPTNAGWQHDVALAHCCVGVVLEAQGQPAAALEAYRKYQAGMERLTAADPTNAVWQHDLSVSQGRIADLLRAHGDLAGALQTYRESLTMFQRLAEADPTDADKQRSVWVSCCKVADLCERTGDTEARRWWRMAFEVVDGMKTRGLFISSKDEQFLQQLRAKADSQTEGKGKTRLARFVSRFWS